MSTNFKVGSKTITNEEALKFADELEAVIGEICNGRRKAKDIPMEPMVSLIQFARDVVKQKPSLYFHKGSVCYLSLEDDQSYGMLCPVSWDSPIHFEEGTKFYTQPLENN